MAESNLIKENYIATLPAKGGEKRLSLGTLAGRIVGELAIAIATVTGITSKVIGLAICNDFLTLIGMFPVPSGLRLGFSLTINSLKARNTSAANNQKNCWY